MSDPVAPDPSQPDSARGAAADGLTGAEAAKSEAAAEAAAETALEAAWEAGYKAASQATATQDVSTPPKRRHPFYLRGRQLRLPQSRRGLFALLLIVVIGGFGGTYSAVSLIQWTETPDFCGRCHTMAPELQAFNAGPHKGLTCADCHVEPGVLGWVKAKINGTKQLIEVVLGAYPTPIPPAIHSEMPSTSDTCLRCHGDVRQAVVNLKTETVYSENETNSPQVVGLLLRPGGGDQFDVNRSVHWHVQRNVTFYSSDEHNQTIDVVDATQTDGSVATYIALSKIKDAGNVGPDIGTIKQTETSNLMSCYDCHNRVGHDIVNPRVALDQQLFEGTIDKTLPYIKREAMQVLWSGYTDLASADAAADGMREFYKLNYPPLATSQAAAIDTAVNQVKQIYRLSSDPEMKVTAKTYPDNLGHLDFPGCFRCHDGAHYKVVNGVATKDVIPSTCDTCHTFPQIGSNVASIPLGSPPTTHSDRLWVFDHKSVATSPDPGGQSCGNCHAKDYCENCHSTGAISVDHAQMATNHAAVIRQQGNATACAYCHQPVFCAACHGIQQVLPVTTPFSTGQSNGSTALPSNAPWALPTAAPTPGASAPATTGVQFPLEAKPPD